MLKIFMHGVPTEYYGPRKAELLIRYLKKFVAPNVAMLGSDAAVTEFVEEAGTFFPIFMENADLAGFCISWYSSLSF